MNIHNCPIDIGDLVVDCDPYKAPEAWLGYGVVIEVLNSDYVAVHWIKFDVIGAINIGNIEVVN